MDFIIEFVIEFILGGAMEAITEKRVPVVIRIILAILLFACYMGLVGMFFYLGFFKKSGLCIGIGIGLLFLIAAVVIKKYRGIKGR